MKPFWIIPILLLAFLLRIIALDKLPSGFFPDEAVFGYDAYSILKTGKDQWGNFFPLNLLSFGDYKFPLESYLSIPSIFIFGLNIFSVRLTESLISVASVLVTFLLSGELALMAKFSKPKKLLFQLISSLLLAISSWHIMLSREAFGFTLTVFFIPLGIYFFLKSLKNPRFLSLSILSFGLNCLTYPSAFLVTPLVFLSLILIFKKELFKKISPKSLLIPVFLLLIFSLLYLFLLQNGSTTRARQLNYFKTAQDRAYEAKVNLFYSDFPKFIPSLTHNIYLEFLNILTTNYLSYFSPQFLFTDGPSEPQFGLIPGRGVLYIFELPFLIFAITALFKLKNSKITPILLSFILLAPIPAALTGGWGFAAHRAATMMPALQLILALGTLELWEFAQRSLPKKALTFLTSLFFIFALACVFIFLENYFIEYPYKFAQFRNYGNVESLQWLKQNTPNNQQIIISRRLSEPHIYTAFVYQIDPQKYQLASKNWDFKQKGFDWVDQLVDYDLQNFKFRNINWSIDQTLKDTILVGLPEEFPQNITPQKIIYYPNKKPALYIVSPN